MSRATESDGARILDTGEGPSTANEAKHLNLCAAGHRPHVALRLLLPLFVTVLSVNSPGQPADPAPRPATKVEVDASRVMTLGEWAAWLRDKGAEVYVARAQLERKVFVSEGVYEIEDLIGALAHATGLWQRRIADLVYLVEERGSWQPGPHHVQFEPEALAEAKEQLRFLQAGAAFRQVIGPFEASVFGGREVLRFDDLSPAQRTWLAERLAFTREWARLGAPQPTRESVTAELKGKDLQFGSSWLLLAYMYAQQGEANGRPLFRYSGGFAGQICYDYADELDPCRGCAP